DSPRGPIQSHWRRLDGGLELRVRVPANTTAVVHVPTGGARSVTEDGAGRSAGRPPVAAGDAPGVKVLETKPDELVLEVGSGDYRFFAR
ncbi:MAG: alpha-L-rhamnosidase C-terminal domain-containing protein, partial [Planctomycetota bacterium]